MSREPVATLPRSARDAFKEPLGPVFEDADALLADAGHPLIAVGDVVTYHLAEAGRPPDVAVVDGMTERTEVDEDVAAGLPALERRVEVRNEAATLSAALVRELVAAIDADDATLLVVDGEEDLATVPAVLAAPDGATVVYGQPGEGMVRVNVTPAVRERTRDLAERLETTGEFWELIE